LVCLLSALRLAFADAVEISLFFSSLDYLLSTNAPVPFFLRVVKQGIILLRLVIC